jgi:outer membrane protein OmpA-like peptidoglycan-associated protein
MKPLSLSGLLRGGAALSLVLGLGVAGHVQAQTDPPILLPPGGGAADAPAAETGDEPVPDDAADDDAEADADPVEEVEVEELGVEEPEAEEPEGDEPEAAAPEVGEPAEGPAEDDAEADDAAEEAPDVEPAAEADEVEPEDLGVEEPQDAEPEADVPAVRAEDVEPEDGEPDAEPEDAEPEDEPVDEDLVDEEEPDEGPEDDVEEAEVEAEAEDEVEEEDDAEEADEEVEAEDILDEEELEAAQRESIEAAVAARLAEEEAKPEAQREEERRSREQTLGAALAGAAIGALLPEIGARLVGQVGDRVILQQDDRLVVRSDETRRFLAAGGESVAEELAEGRMRITTTYPDGTRIVTLRDASGELVRRVRILPNGDEIVLFNDTGAARLAAEDLPLIRRDQQRTYFLSQASPGEIDEALAAGPIADLDRRFSIRQIREHEELRWLMPSLALDAVTFETDSAELGIDQIRALDEMGRALAEMIASEPDEVFLVEGHTDAVGSDVYNLTLSDQRAETVATLLSEQYGVPPENLVPQGFGEQDLKVPTMGPSRENRRVELRRITPLLR